MLKDIINPFTLIIKEKEIRPGAWSVNEVSVLNNEKKIGEYTRQYPSFTKETFFPFKKNDKWYALVSAKYTCSEIMDLQTGKIIGGEEESPSGFCPVEFWVPKRYLVTDKKYNISYYSYETDTDFYKEENDPNIIYGDMEYAPFGFVAGCIWGDDSSWKIQMIDLKNADKGIIIRTDPFDYASMPHNLTLKNAIQIEDDDNDGYITFNMSVLKRFNLKK